MGQLAIVTGPSCIGKGPLVSALRRMRPDLAQTLRPLVLYNDRPPGGAEPWDDDVLPIDEGRRGR